MHVLSAHNVHNYLFGSKAGRPQAKPKAGPNATTTSAAHTA